MKNSGGSDAVTAIVAAATYSCDPDGRKLQLCSHLCSLFSNGQGSPFHKDKRWNAGVFNCIRINGFGLSACDKIFHSAYLLLNRKLAEEPTIDASAKKSVSSSLIIHIGMIAVFLFAAVAEVIR